MHENTKYITSFILVFLLLQIGISQDNNFRVGIIKYKTKEAIEETYTPLMSYLAKKLGQEVEINIYDKGEDVGYLLVKDRLDLGIFTPFPYLIAKSEFNELEVFATHSVSGRNAYSGCILVHKDSKIDSLHQLGGRHFTFVKQTSTSGYTYPRGIFEENNLDIDAGFFSEMVFSGGHDQSLRALLDRKTDGIAIDDDSFLALSATEKNQLTSLAKYEVPYHAYVLNPNLDPSVVEGIKEIMFDAHLDPEAKEYFANNPLQISKWHPQSDQAYNSMRKYLQLERVKPSLQFFLELMPSAEAKFAGGDQATIIERNIINRLKKFNRFQRVSPDPVQNGKSARLEVGLAGNKYHSVLYLEDESLWENDFEESEITDKKLADNIANSLMAEMPIETQLLYRKKANIWFVNYGSDDGIDEENYLFLMGEEELPVAKLNMGSTFFQPHKGYQEGGRVEIIYKMPDNQFFSYDSSSLEIDEEGGFWRDPDHVWGVIGLAVALLTVAIGSYFAGKKKKRFRTILYGANNILKLYIEGEKDIQARLLKKKEKINRSLEKGHINENQFLILMHRLDDIDYLMSSYLVTKEALPEEVMVEIQKIFSDGIITEAEYSQLVTLIKTASLDNS
jgi:phosphate/phosphite/phosphonate ABC transporter binding protein